MLIIGFIMDNQNAISHHTHSPFSENNHQIIPDLPSLTPSSPKTVKCQFTGNASEYFKIWISNLFLTIITLSFYAPWAKVRRLRYFYGNTHLENFKFDFTASPKGILIGRIIAVVLLLFVSFISAIDPTYSLIIYLISSIAVPWVIYASLRFMARNTKYGNSRFMFNSSTLQAYKTLFLCVVVTFVSFGLLYPLALYWYQKYKINHLQIGHWKFHLNTRAGGFFKAIILPMIFAILAIIALQIVLFVSTDAIAVNEVDFTIMGTLIALFYGFIYLFIAPLMRGYLFKATWSSVSVGNNYITNNINPFKFAWILISNYIAIILSFGLLSAWASVRFYRYKIESLEIILFDNPEQLSNIAQQENSSLAEEISDVFDIDVSL